MKGSCRYLRDRRLFGTELHRASRLVEPTLTERSAVNNPSSLCGSSAVQGSRTGMLDSTSAIHFGEKSELKPLSPRLSFDQISHASTTAPGRSFPVSFLQGSKGVDRVVLCSRGSGIVGDQRPSLRGDGTATQLPRLWCIDLPTVGHLLTGELDSAL
jgi:hypothetical protein